MPAIRKSTDLLNNFNEIREFCQNYREPLFLTNDGQGELAVMSIETYELLAGKLELYSLIDEGLDQYKQGKVKPMKESIQFIRSRLNQ